MLQIGCSSFFGLGATSLLEQRAALAANAVAPIQRAKSVVLVFLTGGGSHIDMFDPFVLKDDPNKADFKVQGLSLIDGLNTERLERRRALLTKAISSEAALSDTESGRQFSDQFDAAYSMLTTGRLKKAFEIDQETSEVRERYGRNRLGQTLLLARRMIEAEILVVQCNMGIVQSWDTHVDHFPRLTNTLLPPTDQSVSALLDDLVDRGLLDSTLVIIVGEFGSTPTISPLSNQAVPGRHHWAHGYTAVFSGAGVRGGQVIGKTDRTGGYPVTVPWSPSDNGATVFDALGIPLESDLHSRLGRPYRLNRGKVIDSLYT